MLTYTDYDIVFQEIPDEVTLAINLSNCPHRCPGCHSPQLQENIGEELTENIISELLEKYGNSITCVCFMGGDSAHKDVQAFADYIQRKSLGKIKSAWYSGFNELVNKSYVKSFDFIKIGSYQEKFGPLNKKSTNQRLYKITDGRMDDITYQMQR